jgi:hypothetical protein
MLLEFIRKFLFLSLSLGLFHRGIAMSGSGLLDAFFQSSAPSLAKRQAALLNCPADSSQQIKDCLMKKDAQEIASSLSGLTVSAISKHSLAHFSV